MFVVYFQIPLHMFIAETGPRQLVTEPSNRGQDYLAHQWWCVHSVPYNQEQVVFYLDIHILQ